MHPVADSVFGPARSQLVSVSLLAYAQLLQGHALLSGLAEERGSRALGGLGVVERGLPVMRRLFHSPRQLRNQALPVDFAAETVAGDCRSRRGRTAFRLLLQRMARQFGGGIQALLLPLDAQARRRSFGQGLLGLLLRTAAQAEQDGQVGCHGWQGDVASVDG